MLKISDQLSLPIDAITSTFAVMAMRGVGKTSLASVMAEEMLKAGQPIVAYDPTGAWWGLKSSAAGKRRGFPVVIFGGEHADVPLEESAGETIARVIIERRVPAVLDVSLLRKGARVRFMTAFCETLYHRNREALHLFLDEAHTVCPQNIRAVPEAARLETATKRSVWTCPTQPYPGEHFATFPDGIVSPCVLAGCPDGGVVLDPFSGSGTTAAVAIRTGRRFVGTDVRESQVELTKRRIASVQLELI